MTQPPLECLKPMIRGAYITPSIIILFLYCWPQFASAAETAWSCKETIYYNIYESAELTESRVEQNLQRLEWINQDTIGFQSFTLRRSSKKSDVFVKDDGDFKAVFMNDRELPHLVVLMESQTWMNKFGHLRVRFYRCLP